MTMNKEAQKINKEGTPSTADDEEAKGRLKALDSALSQIEKQFGTGAVMTLGSHRANREVRVIPTGALTLDIALGTGGFPCGRVIEIYGPESSGKSTLATHVVANAQAMGGKAVYIDAEHALDTSYAKKIGVDINQLLISQPSSGEEALSIAEFLARSGAVDVIVIDSVAALVPKAELEGEIGDSAMGMQARMMSQALRKLTATLAKTGTCAIFINQLREKIGVFFGNPETTTGGRALKFFSSIRVDIRRISGIKGSDGRELGSRVRAKVVKNKMAPPFQVGEFDILNCGISEEGAVLDAAINYGVVQQKGSWFSFLEQKLGQGRDTVRDALRSDSTLLNKIKKLVFEKVRQQQA